MNQSTKEATEEGIVQIIQGRKQPSRMTGPTTSIQEGPSIPDCRFPKGKIKIMLLLFTNS